MRRRSNNVAAASDRLLQHSGGFPFSRRLRAHRSCINALAFSSAVGRFLASGGDDLDICLWDLHQDDNFAPHIDPMLIVPIESNIFTLRFSTKNKYLFSGGADHQVFKFDIESLSSSVCPRITPAYVFRDQTVLSLAFEPLRVLKSLQENIREITCHPFHDELFMSASEDGSIWRYDCRVPMHSGGHLLLGNEACAVQYHPRMEHLFLTADASGRLRLRDARMAFSPSTNRNQQGVVQRYSTKLTKRSEPKLCHPEVSSATFDQDGARIAATFQHYLPVVYSVSDPDPIAILDAKKQTNGDPITAGERSYRNECTMKHGSFGGTGLTADLYAAGSDDFRAYIWKLPSTSQLEAQRRILSIEDWESYGDSSLTTFTESQFSPKVAPVTIEQPTYCLKGHESIVNTTLFHPHLLHVATSGVERDIILHSATTNSPCTQGLNLTPTTTRQLGEDETGEERSLYVAALLGLPSPDDTNEADERRTIRLFDQIIRQEGTVDVFQTRRCSGSDTSDEDEMDQDSDSDEDVEIDTD